MNNSVCEEIFSKIIGLMNVILVYFLIYYHVYEYLVSDKFKSNARIFIIFSS